MAYDQADAAVDPFSAPLAWIGNLIVYAIGLVVAVFVLGGALYYTWNPLAAAFSFTQPIHGYWTFTLTVLGLYVVYTVWGAAKTQTTLDVVHSRASALDVAGKAAVVFALAWIIATRLA
jgi:hypothetical protein